MNAAPIRYQRGSEWRRWDLHIHTPASALNNQYPKNADGSPDWDKFIDELETVRDVSVVGLTDYFSIDGYKTALRYREKGRLENFDLILPNVELRLDTFVVRKKSRDINFHVIFSDELDLEIIEKEFLEALNVFIDGSVNGISGERQLNKRTLREIGRKVKERHSIFGGDSDIVAAMKNITVSLGQVQALLRKDLFTSKFLFVLSGNEWADIDWHQAYLTKRNFLMAAHVLETGSKDTIGWALGRKDLTEEDFVAEFGGLKPCIHGSDAHRLDRICRPAEDKFCWMKADPTFEGLCQIVYEPEARVRVQVTNPEAFKIGHSLKTISMSECQVNPELKIQKTVLPLNRDLVAVIGGKGTGKTALLDLIANCYVNRARCEDKNSFARRIADGGEALKVGLTFVEGSEFAKNLLDEHYCVGARVEYIPQGRIEQVIESYREFQALLQRLVFESSKVKDLPVVLEYQETSEAISRCHRQIVQLNREIFDLEEQTRDQIVREVNAKGELAESTRKDLQKEIEMCQRQLTREKINEAKAVNEELAGHQERRQSLLELRDLVTGVLGEVELVRAITSRIERVNELAGQLGLPSAGLVVPNYEGVTESLRCLLFETTDGLRRVTGLIGEIRTRVETLEEQTKRHSALLGSLGSTNSQIKDLEGTLLQFQRGKKLLQEKRAKRLVVYSDLVTQHLELRRKYDEIISAFSDEAQEILSGLEFKAHLSFDLEQFEAEGEEVIDLRNLRSTREGRVTVKESTEFQSLVDMVHRLSRIGQEAETDQAGIVRDFVRELDARATDCSRILKSTRNNLHLYEWLFDDYYSLNTSIYFNKAALDKLSLGQKCTVLIKVYLAQGRDPILIDQPDDNLDNAFIMDELVKALRQAKGNRQVIIATNNANVVVNGDAEQLVIASFERGVITYETGAIEEPMVREQAIDILEGGPEAFRKREAKYRFAD